ncbi:MAG TPA: acetate kinase [Propionibacteriaceae bacterium]|nr:acetate kinase [Propionibacteriaceae bacterium]
MATPILLLNCGSSSIKYQVIDAESEAVMATGLIQKIGLPSGTLDHTVAPGTPEERAEHLEQPIPDHADALRLMTQAFADLGPSLAEVKAVGHRTVHGGEKFRRTVRIDDSVIQGLRDLSPLAPLHNPPGIAGIEAAMATLPNVPHVAIFDTAFFSTLPAEAYTYAIDAELAATYGIRKYGFHGTSHSYVSKKAAATLGRDLDDLNQIVCHLGNGASISAIRGGVAIETSMGLTPLQGLVMGTRPGDVDPGLHAFLAREGMTIDEIDTMLNKKSGLAGMTGGTSDFRDLDALIESGDQAARLAYGVYIHRLVSYIGSYLALLGGVDVLVFTAGVGENAANVRESVCDRLAPLGFLIDDEANAVRSKQPRVISQPGSPVTIMVVPTNEELMMARETVAVLDEV